MCEQCGPVDFAVSWRQVVIVLTLIVTGVHHPEMPRQLMNHRSEIPGEMCMPSVEANTNLASVHGSQNPEEIPRSPSEKVRKHVLEYKTNT